VLIKLNFEHNSNENAILEFSSLLFFELLPTLSKWRLVDLTDLRIHFHKQR
jgi:hypothetical protein